MGEICNSIWSDRMVWEADEDFSREYYIKKLLDGFIMKREAFVRLLGVDESTVKDFLTGSKDISEEFALKLSLILGTSVDYWLHFKR